MSPFQRAREEAISMRVRLVSERADEPVPATQLLLPIESKLNLGVELVESGAPELGNGDACLRRVERFIYVRKSTTAEEYAALVAHELGHWQLDEARESLTVASLAALDGVEGSPGVVRVEAYGARERQELQANVFARELLLPRHVARALFAKGVGARRAAADLGIPLRIARQQMLDAVLLPMAAYSSPKVLFSPSATQKRAARAGERFANVVAGPGTGKTSTLIHRVKYLIDELKAEPGQILVLTFTNKAAFELVERLRSAGIARAADIWAGTFHAFGLEFLRKYHEAFNLPNNIVVADKLNEVVMLSRELPNLALRHHLRVEDPYEWLGNVVQGIKRLKEELVTPRMYRKRLADLDDNDAELDAQRKDVATLYEAHERLLRQFGLVDFVDLVALPAMSIREDRAKYSELADKFQYVLVDEYQDVTAAMVELIKQLAQKAKSLWVVGDVRQAIHHWRGASLKSLIIFEQTFKEQADSTKSRIRKYPLDLNRRSSQEIVDLVNRCGEVHVLQSVLPLDKTTASAGQCGVMPVLLSCSSANVIPEAVTKAIKHFHAKGIVYSQQSVLCRRTADVEHIASELHQLGIVDVHAELASSWPTIEIGGSDAGQRAIRPWADGWRFGIGDRRESTFMFVPACVAAGALAVSEAFSLLRRDNPYAGRRRTELSLWSLTGHEPDVPPLLVPEIPSSWLVGLGHLGQAYAWTLGFMRPAEGATLHLQDVDVVTKSTLSTSMLSVPGDLQQKKTRIVARWLEGRGYQTAIVERRFDEHQRVGATEPRLALFGVDNAAARRVVEGVGFRLVIDAGLGSGFRDFRAIRLRTFPGPSVAATLWATSEVAGGNPQAPAYKALLEQGADPCGVTTLATRAVGAPFVGCIAAALVVAELVRVQAGAATYAFVDLNLRNPDRLEAARTAV